MLTRSHGVPRLLFGVSVLLAVLAGCRHKPALNTYRLLRQNGGTVLVPPGVVRADLAQRTFVAHIPAGAGSCLMGGDGAVRIRPGKRKIRVTVNRAALAGQQQPGWLADWTVRAEAEGCVPPGLGQDLGNLIVESVPLDPAVAFRLLHPNDVVRGFVDLGPENRLQVYSPIVNKGTPTDAPAPEISKISGTGYRLDVDLKTAASVVGVETAWYAIRPNLGHPGYHFVPLSADRSIQGVVEHAPVPAVNYFEFPPDAAFFRLSYKSSDNGVLAIVTFGSTREELDRRTKIVANDPGGCEKPQGICRTLPWHVGVNPYLVVNVNGSDIAVLPRTDVRGAIRAAGVKDPERVLSQLHVIRLFGQTPLPVVFDPKSHEILDLPLTGRERISWQMNF